VSLADAAGLDLLEAAGAKLRENAAKYPVEQAKGSAKKYDELASWARRRIDVNRRDVFARNRLRRGGPIRKAADLLRRRQGAPTSGYLLTRESSLNSLPKRTIPDTSGVHPDDRCSLPWAIPTTGW